jgi:hypothetical protein
LPQEPLSYLSKDRSDERWEYEAFDSTTGNAYLILKKSIYNYNFIDEDSFDLSLIEASFHNPELFDKQISRKQVRVNGLTGLEVKEKLKDSTLIKARYFINGPHQYVVAVRYGKKVPGDADDYLNSFAIKPFHYPAPKLYVDTFLHTSVMSPVVPEMDAGMRKLAEQASENNSNGNNATGYSQLLAKGKTRCFQE